MGLFLLWLLVEAINHMQETIRRDDIVECLAATLGIDVAAHIGEFAQQVEAVEEDGQVLLGQTFGDACIPHQFIRVHRGFAISPAAIHRQVAICLQLEEILARLLEVLIKM